MKLSAEGLALLKHFEGCRLVPYRDVGGILTCGWGHVGDSVAEGHAWTQQEADDQLEVDVAKFEAGVSLVTASLGLTQCQFDALCTLAFNIGLRAFEQSTLLMLLEKGEVALAADEFLRWRFVGGKVSPGLVARRAAERETFLRGTGLPRAGSVAS